MAIAYVVAECRPSTDQDEFADIAIGDDSYVFCAIEPVANTGDWQQNISNALLIAMDIERTKPEHKHITLHAGSLMKLLQGLNGETL